MIDFLIKTIAGILSGILGALGLGGGGVLLLYLTLFADTAQLTAQGINLIFFLPCAAIAVWRHRKSGLIDKPLVKKFALFGLIGAAAGFLLAGLLGGEFLRKVFGCFLIGIGILSIFRKNE